MKKFLLAAVAFLALTTAARAADSTVSAMSAASALDGTELYYCVQGGADRKCTGAQIKTWTSASPTLVTPNLGTPSAGVMTNVTGTAAGLTAGTVTTNANLTGPITSTGNATAVAAQTGTGSTFVMNTSPTLVTPVLGVATASSLAIAGCTIGTDELCVTGQTTLSSTLTLSSISGSTQCLNVNTSGVVSGTGSACGSGGGGSPGTPDTSVQTNQGGVFTGNANFVWNNISNILTVTASNTASSPAILATGTWFTGGTATTTKPQLLVEATGAVTTGWSTAGTGLGINAASGFTGNLIDLQVNGTSFFAITRTASTVINQKGHLTITDVDAGPANLVDFFYFGTTLYYGGGAKVTITDTVGALTTYASGGISWTNGANSNTGTVDTTLSRNAAGIVQFGTTAANASGAWLAAKGTITAGTLGDGLSALTITATQPASPTGPQTAINVTVTGAGSAAQANLAANVTYAAGYTGAAQTIAIGANNLSAGTGAGLVPTIASGFPNSAVVNSGSNSNAGGTTAGTNVGIYGSASVGNVNVGVLGLTQISKTGAGNKINIAVAGAAYNEVTGGSTPIQVGGWFVLNQTTAPTVSAALIADNGAQTSPIFLARDNGTTVFTIADGGNVSATAALFVTGNISSSGGTVASGTTFLDGTNQIIAIGNVTILARNGGTGEVTLSSGASNIKLVPTSSVVLPNNGAASIPPLTLTGTWFTGGSATTTKPHVLIEPTGATSTAWSTSGTGLGINAASGFVGTLLDLQINGGFLARATTGGIAGGMSLVIYKAGNPKVQMFNGIDWTPGLYNTSEGGIAWSSSTTTFSGLDTWLMRDSAGVIRFSANSAGSSAGGSWLATTGYLGGVTTNAILTGPAAATLQLGAADVDTNASIVAQNLRTQGALTGGTTNQAGKDFTVIVSPGKGTGAGGAFVLQTAPAGASGSTPNTPVTGFKMDSAGLITYPTILTDSGKTTSTVCQDTTTHGLYFGSGALGVCAGTSSMRYKHDIKPLKPGLAEIMKLDTVSFFFNQGYGDNGASEKYGFTAENMLKPLPKLVNLDAEGKPSTIDWSGLLPVIVNAIKELKADNDNLRAQIRKLSARK